jgi:nicotinamidase-related amidase
MNTALILIDIQNDYFPGGKMELQGSTEAAINAARVLDRFRREGMPVIHIQHVSTRPGSTFFLEGTEGMEIHNSVKPGEGETVLIKHYPNSFRETPLFEILKSLGVTNLMISGMMTHMCVDATVRAAFDLGFTCTVVHDACATRDLAFNGTTVKAAEVHGAFLSALSAVYAKMIPASEAEAMSFK